MNPKLSNISYTILLIGFALTLILGVLDILGIIFWTGLAILTPFIIAVIIFAILYSYQQIVKHKVNRRR